MGTCHSKSDKIKRDKNHNRQKMFKFGIGFGRNSLNLEGHLQMGYNIHRKVLIWRGSGKSVCTPFPIQTPGTHYKMVWIRTSTMQIEPVCISKPLWITVTTSPCRSLSKL